MSNTAQIVNIKIGEPAMPSKNGYVMAWRDIKKQDWYVNPECLAVFIHIMLSATSKPLLYNRKGVNVMLSAGQFATSYEDIAAVFNLHKSKVRRFIKIFEKSGQIEKATISVNRINKGLILTFINWNKWQKPLENTDTQADTQADTPSATYLKVCGGSADTQADTQADTVLNNKVLNNNKNTMLDSVEPSTHFEIREKAFNHFWVTWSNCKKIIGKTNTAPKGKTREKFLALMTNTHVSKIGVDGFRSEIMLMCDLAIGAHKDLKEDPQSSFANFKNMYPLKYLTNKQWRDCAEYKELTA